MSHWTRSWEHGGRQNAAGLMSCSPLREPGRSLLLRHQTQRLSSIPCFLQWRAQGALLGETRKTSWCDSYVSLLSQCVLEPIPHTVAGVYLFTFVLSSGFWARWEELNVSVFGILATLLNPVIWKCSCAQKVVGHRYLQSRLSRARMQDLCQLLFRKAILLLFNHCLCWNISPKLSRNEIFLVPCATGVAAW